MIKKTLLSFLLVCGPVLNLQASGFGKSSKGTVSGQFLQLGVGGRAVGMAEAYSAVADEASALYWNVGALTRIQRQSVTAMHATYIDSSYFDYGAYAHNLGQAGAFGVGVQYFSSGKIDETDTGGNTIGSFTPSDYAVSLGYAYPIAGYSAGIAVKYINSKIVDSASTLSGDVGFLTPAYLDNKLRLAFTAKNLFGGLKYTSETEDLPAELRLGSSYKVSDQWLASLDAVMPRGDEAYAAVGTEYTLGKREDGFGLATRAGYNSKTSGDIDGFTGFSFGLGFLLKTLSVDYGIVPFGDLGISHRFSLTYNF